HGGGIGTAIRRAESMGGCPTVSAGIVASAAIQKVVVISSPDDHFVPGPDCGVTISAIGRIDDAGGCPTVGAGIIPPAGVKIDAAAVISAPDDHFAAGPDCRVKFSAGGGIDGARRCPTVRGPGVSSPRVGLVIAAPN